MKQYTSKDQTDKLIELGFPKPTRIMAIGGFPPKDTLARYASYKDDFDSVTCYEGYSIGELIEFLPPKIEWEGIVYSRVIDIESIVYYSWNYEIYFGSDLIFETKELIDSLFKACVTLKEEGVI